MNFSFPCWLLHWCRKSFHLSFKIKSKWSTCHQVHDAVTSSIYFPIFPCVHFSSAQLFCLSSKLLPYKTCQSARTAAGNKLHLGKGERTHQCVYSSYSRDTFNTPLHSILCLEYPLPNSSERFNWSADSWGLAFALIAIWGKSGLMASWPLSQNSQRSLLEINARGYGLPVLGVAHGAGLIVRLQRIQSVDYPRGIKVLANCLPLPLKLVTNWACFQKLWNAIFRGNPGLCQGK